MAKRGTKAWKQNISTARAKVRIVFNCEKCGKTATDKPSHYKRKVRHFCSAKCYALFRKENLPKEEHNRFGKGHGAIEEARRKQARSILNHHLRDKKLSRPNCEVCGEKAEAHHDNYAEPLKVRWLCFKHHRQFHYENPELLANKE